MCTVLFHRSCGVLTKNRDKNVPTCEEIVRASEYIALNTKGANYFGIGINRNGIAFASTAVNTPEWTRVAGLGKVEEAKKIFKTENKGLFHPSELISNLLPTATCAEACVEKLIQTPKPWMGYNIILADNSTGFVVEIYGEAKNIRKLKDRDVITNHFLSTKHGPRKYKDYPNSYDRLTYASSLIEQASTIEEITEIIKPTTLDRQAKIWRKGAFHTVSSTILNFKNKSFWHTNRLAGPYREYGIVHSESKINFVNKMSCQE